MPGLVGEVWWEFTHQVFAKSVAWEELDRLFLCQGSSSSHGFHPPSVNLSRPQGQLYGGEVRGRQPAALGEMCRHPAAEWSTFCCSLTVSKPRTSRKLEKVLHGGL